MSTVKNTTLVPLTRSLIYIFVFFVGYFSFLSECRIIERTTPENYKPIPPNDYFTNESPIHSKQAKEDEADLMPDTLPPATKRNVNDPEITEATHVRSSFIYIVLDFGLFDFVFILVLCPDIYLYIYIPASLIRFLSSLSFIYTYIVGYPASPFNER